MLVVEVYNINETGHEQVIGEYRLVDGEIEVYPPGSPILEILRQDRRHYALVPPDPEGWLRSLLEMMRGSYLYAGHVQERPDDSEDATERVPTTSCGPACPSPTRDALEQMSQRIEFVRAGLPPGFTMEPTPGGTLVLIYGPGIRVVYSPLEEKIVYRGQLATMRAETIVGWMSAWHERKGAHG
jgi:hypothetical protein